MAQPIIHLMHHDQYQRLNHWPGIQDHIMQNLPDFQAWIRSPRKKNASTAFAPVSEKHPEQIRFLPSRSLPKLGAYVPGLWRMLRDAKPRMIIVSGYAEPYYQQAFWYAKKAGIPILFMWESQRLSARYTSGPLHSLKKYIVAQYDGFITPGSRASAYLEMLGIDSVRIFQGVNGTDMATLVPVIKANDPGPAAADTPCRFLYLGRYLELKGVRELLAAFAHISPEQATLTFAGYGPLEAELTATARDMPHVYFKPKFTHFEEGLNHYLASDVLVMPSTTRYGRSDVWGFVINEALACGCYVLAGETVGAVPELITQAPLDVGMTFDPDNASEFVSTLHAAIHSAKHRDRDAIMSWGQSIDGTQLGQAFVRAIQVTDNA